jgi:uncharacterized protein YndB with AHSA1/START domain
MAWFGRFAAVIVACALAACATSPERSATSACAVVTAQNPRTLCHEAVVDAEPSEVWALISTSEGWRSWAAPVAHVDLRVGGEIETSYNANAVIGGPGNIHNRIVALRENRSLAIQIAEAPPGFPHAEEARTLGTVIDLTRTGDGTRITIAMSGFREGAAYDALHGFFDAGNAYTLNKLVERIENGPTDWSAQRAE